MDTNNRYYDLIEKLVKNHRKFQGYEAILDEIVSDVYAHSEEVIKTIDNEAVIQSYLQKVVSTSIITVPKRLNFHNELNHRTISANSNAVVEQVQNDTINEPEQLEVDSSVNSDAVNEIEKEDAEQDEIIEASIPVTPLEEIENNEDLELEEPEYVKSNPELVNKMINSIASDMVSTASVNEEVVLEEPLELNEDVEDINLPEIDVSAEEEQQDNINEIDSDADFGIEEETLEIQDESSNIEDDELLEIDNSLNEEDVITLEEEPSIQNDDEILYEIGQNDEGATVEEMVLPAESAEISEEVDAQDTNLIEEISFAEDTSLNEEMSLVQEAEPIDTNSEENKDNLLNSEPQNFELENDSDDKFNVSEDNELELSEDTDELELKMSEPEQEEILALNDNEEDLSESSADIGLIEESGFDGNEQIDSMLEESESIDINLPEPQDLIPSSDENENITFNLEEDDTKSGNEIGLGNNISLKDDEGDFKLMDYSAFNYTPSPSDSSFNDEHVGAEILNLQNSRPELNVLKVFELKYKKNMTISEIAKELQTDKSNIIMALDELIKLV